MKYIAPHKTTTLTWKGEEYEVDNEGNVDVPKTTPGEHQQLLGMGFAENTDALRPKAIEAAAEADQRKTLLAEIVAAGENIDGRASLKSIKATHAELVKQGRIIPGHMTTKTTDE